MGIKRFWTSAAALAIAYPAVHYLSNLYIRSLSASGQCTDYAGIITEYLGKNWGIVLSAAYFLTLTKGMLAYSATITHDAASYLALPFSFLRLAGGLPRGSHGEPIFASWAADGRAMGAIPIFTGAAATDATMSRFDRPEPDIIARVRSHDPPMPPSLSLAD
ncbi:hypothetical protein [Cupriavidus sp. UYPR2.512]|uniref:hypothetical protein n=1 Tax=Cupriavidus sp. UYPR2.512 TaxID=1080187 RepID=UPI0003722148|nr:hypothetical protein [Cupriavidus sp. UYPR2.512]UIF87883.1 hypothetical protein KAF44_21280 [Cupriavidus necator]